MTALEIWEQRPSEEANLFNPAFIGSLMFEFVKAYQSGKDEGAPFSFLPLVLAVALHRNTRSRLPSKTVTSLYQWVQDNEDVLINLDKRIGGLMPYIREALRFAIAHGALRFGAGHNLVLGETKAHFPAPFTRETTNEISTTIDKSKFMARWLLKSGSEASILACWGIRP